MHVLVSGAGIAGSALAALLLARGHRVTVVESAPRPRPGGQAVDVRGPALEVMDRLGLGEPMRAARTVMRGMSVVAPDGTELTRTTETTLTGGPLGSPDVEILRDDLAALLVDAAAGTEWCFGDRVAAIGADGVRLAGGRTLEPDVVVGADGLRSAVGRLAGLVGDGCLRPLGSHLAVYTMPNVFGLDRWQTFCRFPDGMAGLYTARENREVRVNLGFEGEAEYDHRDVAAQKQLIADAFAGRGWWVPRMLEGLADASDFYLAPMTQVVAPRWSTGRTVLLGDAAWCTTPLSGQGTTLALVGAYLLAHELDVRPVGEAFAAYEDRMRPVAEADQRLALENSARVARMMDGAADVVAGSDEHWSATSAATALALP
ncbi:FAD-dependent monooxygenase [Actinomycetospora soli]|uniref:FAD-dependent monooxygenase n=1 Tax=Actinomycetospora soli TaxID=2893887 RepID=UPI001E61FE05|nr:FAD-dependent monooxygenase [Actinomycetospora soli]MCD2188919.1 FAD-dependent monooxygenase [Actinomycetospora soli]